MGNNERKIEIPKWISWIFILLLLVFLFNTMDVATPFLIGAVIAWFLNIYAEFLEKIGLKRNLAVFISFGSCFILILTAVLFIIPTLTKQVVQITTNIKVSISEIHKAGLRVEKNNINDNTVKTKKSNNKNKGATNEVEKIQKSFYIFFNGLYEKFPILKENINKEEAITFLESKQEEIGNFLVKFVNNAVSNVSSFLSHIFNIILIPIFTFYFLVLMKPLKERINYLVNKSPYASYIKNISENIIKVLENYIRGMFISSTLFGVTVGIGSYIISFFFHTKYSLVIGCVTIFLSVIPYIGMFLISIIAGLIAYFTSGGNLLAGAIMVLMVQTVNFTFDNYISPKIVGDSIGIHPLVSMFAMLAGGKLFGFWGLILGSPCAGVIKIFMMKLYPTLFEEMPETENKEAETENKEAETENKEAETENKEAETENKEAETENKEAETENKEAETENKEAETENKEAETENKEAEAENKEAEIENKEAETENKEAEAENKEAEIDNKTKKAKNKKRKK